MRLTLYTDYSFRTLLYLGLHPDKLSTITEISEAYGISRNHLVKVVHRLAKLEYIQSIRGRNGGLKLKMAANKVRLGEVILHTEESMALLECFEPKTNTCPLINHCSLTGILQQAQQAFIDSVNQFTLADLLHQREHTLTFFNLNALKKTTNSP